MYTRSQKRFRRVFIFALTALTLVNTSYVALAQAKVNTSKAQDFSPALRVKVAADDVNLRSKPSVDAQIVLTLKKGTVVEVEQKEEQWCKVNYGRYNGYVSAEYLDLPDEFKNDIEYTTLTMGMNSAEVLTLQEKLSQLGYYNSHINGTYGSKTRDAVRKFQKDNDLTANGIADAETQKVLYQK